MGFKRIKLVIEYDGSFFHGWQVQNNQLSVQGEIEKAIFKITGEKVSVTGSGRTDAGVHAFGQVAHFDTQSRIPAEKFAVVLNTVLPPSIAVISSKEVSPDFHARFSAIKKTYKYKVLNRPMRSPIMDKRAWHVPWPLDIESMNRAAAYFIGRHDFTAFCASGHNVKNFVREIYVSEWTEEEGCFVYTVTGNGFLYNMVRIMTGTMVEVGLNKRSAENIPELLEKKNRRLAGITAPPYGLYLWEVFYDEENPNGRPGREECFGGDDE
ncbi:tRNA pseudouridine synthase A [Thermoclostridium stercorarium subsp. stercorarium DSM 8532]|uniref:tRNA pseudouridine synthase A n=3 Tax=Thermoclostridium stercorarium TaxID=1510 RepID=L7VKX6_THES1|nr:tRNA pseudouridine(38-40) synthase TruA [Thermoclostridium stercorarium]AGC67319.1 tRNA pseudouridine synthase A [Thermoclostridium stercorarium subsp. stercorarium DSM 8532]AGI38381.1 pseudouridylate synthase-1 [Thermoclostridium stercorarium subsp. stercorarium DSM 8532]ANW97817.1 tRNA pseudouridine(38,39,40) synthase TruA [Thermoclostridium stercorarium subsp. thermolacticum DSM 2910]ANX02593.1 tRNA pseudouridine(38,39,40) synthase TruA [Thermoclostridium stercorarium subsp. leptospartum 